MDYLYSFFIILGASLAGETLCRLLPLPVPAAVYGLVLLFAALQLGLVKVERIRTAGNWLIGIMGLLFVSPVVNLLDSWDLVKDRLLPVAVIVGLSTLAVFGAAGRLTQWLRRKGGKPHD